MGRLRARCPVGSPAPSRNGFAEGGGLPRGRARGWCAHIPAGSAAPGLDQACSARAEYHHPSGPCGRSGSSARNAGELPGRAARAAAALSRLRAGLRFASRAASASSGLPDCCRPAALSPSPAPQDDWYPAATPTRQTAASYFTQQKCDLNFTAEKVAAGARTASGFKWPNAVPCG